MVEKKFALYSNKNSNYGILVPKPPSSFLPNERWCMSSPTSPDPDPDAPEPDSSRPVPDGGNDGAPEPPEPAEAAGYPPPGDAEEDSAAYLGELMAAAAAGEDLTTEDISGAGFGEGGTAQHLIPGPVLGRRAGLCLRAAPGRLRRGQRVRYQLTGRSRLSPRCRERGRR